MKTTKNNFRGVTTLMVALVIGTILLCFCNVSLAQIPIYWGLQPTNMNPPPIVNEFDGQATFLGEWNQALWAPDYLPQQGTMYGEIVNNWTATASNPGNQFTYPGNTLLLMHDISDLTSQDLWDYNTFEITVDGNKVTMWVLGNGNYPDTLDYQWIGGSCIGYSTIDDRGYLVRLNDDMATDFHWYPGGPEPGDPNFNWNGFFGSYGFNNSAWVLGLPNSTNGANEVYEVAFRDSSASPVRDDICKIKIVIICDPKGNGAGFDNGIRVIIIIHVKPPPPLPPAPKVVIAVPIQIVNVPWNVGPTILPVTIVNEHDSTQSGVAQISSSHGFTVVPATFPYSLSPGQMATYSVTLNIPPDPTLMYQVDTIRAMTNDYCSYCTLHITEQVHQLYLSPMAVTVTTGTTLTYSCAACAPPWKLIPANPTWTMTGVGGTITPVTEPHAPACIAMAHATFTTPGSGMIVVTQDGVQGIAYVNVVSTQYMDINIAPMQPPIVIPPGGGSFQYEINAHNLTTIPQTFNIWNKIRTPGGSYINAFGPITRTLPGGANPTRTLTQTIAGTLPAGMHYYISYIGTYPSTIQDSSFFTFTKLATGAGGPWISEYNTYGDFFEEYATNVVVPVEATLLHCYPNPFNPMTAISYQLQAASHVDLKVYDTAGRLVTTLVAGWREAGSHEVTFDGAGLTSGVYLVSLKTQHQQALQKIVLLK